jgi:O-antigen/teichoic acid export membrane protein
MLNRLKQIWSDPYFRKSGVFFVGSMTVACLNYLYHPVLAHFLSLTDFGDVEALLVFSTMIGTVMGGFTFAAVHASVNCEAKGECSAVIKLLRNGGLAVVGIFFLVLVIGSKSFAGALHFSDSKLFIVLAVSLVVSIFYSLRSAFMQGKGRFVAMSLGGVIVSGGRLALAIVFVLIGWKSFGAIFGLLSAQVIALAYMYALTRHELHHKQANSFPLPWSRIKNEFAYVGLIIVSQVFIACLYSTDIIVVKRFFPADVAGGYSGISTIGNIIFFATAPFAAVMLSQIKRNDTTANHRRAFLKALFVILAIGMAGVLCYAFASGLIVKILLGSRYLPYAHLLPWLGAAFFMASLNNLFVLVGLALRRRGLIILAICGFILVLGVSIIRHSTLIEIAQNYLVADALAAIASFIFIWRDIRKENEKDLGSNTVV